MADNNANIGFERQIWDAACVLWGHIPAAEYRKIIVGLIFLRYISSAFEKRFQQLVEEGDGFEDDIDAYTEENVFFVPEEARWSTIAAAAHTPEIGTVIDTAMRAIEADNTSLKNVLPKNYATPDLDKRVLGDVVDLFTNMDMSDTDNSKDLLGRTYEYCIAQFAAYEGVKGGEFYTPSSVVKTLVSPKREYTDETRNTMFGKDVYKLVQSNGSETISDRKRKSIYQSIRDNCNVLVFYAIDIDAYLGIKNFESNNEVIDNMIAVSKMNYAEGQFAYETKAKYWNAYRSGIDQKTVSLLIKKQNINK